MTSKSRGNDMFSADHNELTIPELYYLLRKFLLPQTHLQNVKARRNFLLITGPSGVGKTEITKSVADILNSEYEHDAQQRGIAQPDWVYKTFFQPCSGMSKHAATIPYVDKGTDANPKEQATLEQLPLRSLSQVKDWLSAAPNHRAVLSLDEILSCADVGFQTALIGLRNDGSLGNVSLTPDEYSRLHILATGNTAEDGNEAVKADRFFLNGFSTCRLVPTRADFLNFVVEPGIVPLHPLVSHLMSSEVLDKYWLQRFGPHEINPRTIEAVSQVVTGLADPMTGMLPTPDTASSAYRETELELRTKIPVALATELMASNEAMRGLTAIDVIVDDPEQAPLPQGGPMAQLMQANLIDAYIKTGSLNNLTPWHCLPHIALFCSRLDAVVQPSISAVSAAVRATMNDIRASKVDPGNKPAIALLDMFDGYVNQWRATTINDNLHQRFQHSNVKVDSRVFQQNFGPKQETAKKQLRTLARGNPIKDEQSGKSQMHVRMPDLVTALSVNQPAAKPAAVKEEVAEVAEETQQIPQTDTHEEDTGDDTDWTF